MHIWGGEFHWFLLYERENRCFALSRCFDIVWSVVTTYLMRGISIVVNAVNVSVYVALFLDKDDAISRIDSLISSI